MSNKTGLVSISFRDRTPEEIAKYTAAAGLDGIEWGGDVHSPHGDTEVAATVRKITDGAGLIIPEYGSYYKIAASEPELFEKALASAKALGTGVIRVWAGAKASDNYKNDEYAAAVADAKRICALAGDITVALECHPKTLTDDYYTALAFIRDVDMPNLKMFWQPNQYRPLEYNLAAIKALLPYIVSVHVFSWVRNDKYPLAYGAEAWEKYIELLSGRELNYMLEFMHDGNIETLAETAATLKGWLNK